MPDNSTKSPVLGSEAETAVHLLDDWFDPIEAGLRDRVRELIQTMIESELEAVLSRPRYARQPEADPENDGAGSVTGHRHGHRSRSLLGTFGRVEIAVPRARLDTAEGKTTEWKSTALRAYQRRTRQADLLIVGAYLSGTNTRRVRRALAAVFGGAVSKDTVSRVWRKVKSDWDAWNGRSLAEEPIVRLILDGTVVRVRLDRKATSIVLLVVLGVREDGQKVLLAVKNMGGETSEAWRAVLDDLSKRGLRRPEFLMVDGGTGLEQALAALWGDVPTQRCTVHKHRNLLAHAPQRLHDEVSADYNDMIYATSAAEIEERRRTFLRRLTLLPDPVSSPYWRPRQSNSNTNRDGTAPRHELETQVPVDQPGQDAAGYDHRDRVDDGDQDGHAEIGINEGGIVTETRSEASGVSDRMSAWARSATAAIAFRPRSSSTRSGSISASP